MFILDLSLALGCPVIQNLSFFILYIPHVVPMIRPTLKVPPFIYSLFSIRYCNNLSLFSQNAEAETSDEAITVFLTLKKYLLG